MKFQIISIGKKHDKNLEEYILGFEKRIEANFDLKWNILNSEDNNNKKVQIKKESSKILDILNKEKGNNYIILLDERGKEKPTVELSNF